MDPLTALQIGSGGLGLARSIFGGKRFRYPTMDPFSFTPSESDPELQLLRRRFLEEVSRGRGRTVDEIGRAGLLGSSAAFDILGEEERRGARGLEDIDASVFARRRAEALDQYNRELDFKRQIALAELGSDLDISGRERLAGLGALGDIGGFLGESLVPGDMEYFDYLKKKKNLPRAALLEASNYDIPLPPRRGYF